MMTLIRKAFWFALFLVFTLGFVTLFDYGVPVTAHQFQASAASEVHDLTLLWHPAKKAKIDEPAK